ncbi:MAG: hypothetical protein ACT4OF_07805 [Caulobacteraceae bacterium]
MAVARKARKADPILEAAIDYFSARSHDAWRKCLLQTNPEQKGKPRMRLRGGVMVDVNQPWSRLDLRTKKDNKRAARDAYEAVKRFPQDREAAAAYVHQCWIKRNKNDASQSKELFKPYARLPEVEKDKDRAHVDRMKQAIAAVRKRATKKAPAKKGKRAVAFKTLRVDAKTWRRLETAAKDLSKLLGRDVTPEALMAAGVEAVAAVCKAAAARAKDA